MHKCLLKLGYFILLNTIFVSSHMYSEGTVILGSMNMGYDIYPTLPGIKSSRNLFHPKCESISLGHITNVALCQMSHTKCGYTPLKAVTINHLHAPVTTFIFGYYDNA